MLIIIRSRLKLWLFLLIAGVYAGPAAASSQFPSEDRSGLHGPDLAGTRYRPWTRSRFQFQAI